MIATPAGTQRRLLLVKGVAGLGNRLLAAATALLWARLSGRRLCVDWRDPLYSDDGDNVFNRFFARPEAGLPGDLETAPRRVAPPVWEGNLGETIGRLRHRLVPKRPRDPGIWRRFTVDPRRFDYDEDVIVFASIFDRVDALRLRCDGEFAGWRRQGREWMLRRLFREGFTPAAAVRERVDRFRGAHFRGVVIGVHVRRSDRRSHFGATMRRLAALRRRLPGATVFLSTDNRRVEERFLRAHPGTAVTRKWLPGDGEAIHLASRPGTRFEHGVEALVDMYLLGACDYLIVDDHSSFGWAASLLSGAPPARIFNVHPLRAVPLGWRRAAWYWRARLRNLAG